MMSSLQTWSFILPVPTVKVTPVASTVNVVLVGVGVVQAVHNTIRISAYVTGALRNKTTNIKYLFPGTVHGK